MKFRTSNPVRRLLWSLFKLLLVSPLYFGIAWLIVHFFFRGGLHLNASELVEWIVAMFIVTHFSDFPKSERSQSEPKHKRPGYDPSAWKRTSWE